MLSLAAPSLQHALLANLRAREYITTNFDDLLEQAFAGAGRPLRVLPYKATDRASAWLLKLHGDLHERDLVLTRTDYLDHARHRTALASIVQALLITKHMVFVGYSLRDEDFHGLLHDVRAAVTREGEESRIFGTVLLAEPAGMLETLWERDLRIVPMAANGAPSDEPSAGGRMVDIFLDRLLAETPPRQTGLPTRRSVRRSPDRWGGRVA